MTHLSCQSFRSSWCAATTNTRPMALPPTPELAPWCPLAWPWKGKHQAHSPAVGTDTILLTGLQGCRMPKTHGDLSAPDSPHCSAEGAEHFSRDSEPFASYTMLQAPQQERCHPQGPRTAEGTHRESSPVEKALVTHFRSRGLKGTRTRWTPGQRFIALSGYMK